QLSLWRAPPLHLDVDCLVRGDLHHTARRENWDRVSIQPDAGITKRETGIDTQIVTGRNAEFRSRILRSDEAHALRLALKQLVYAPRKSVRIETQNECTIRRCLFKAAHLR